MTERANWYRTVAESEFGRTQIRRDEKCDIIDKVFKTLPLDTQLQALFSQKDYTISQADFDLC